MHCSNWLSTPWISGAIRYPGLRPGQWGFWPFVAIFHFVRLAYSPPEYLVMIPSRYPKSLDCRSLSPHHWHYQFISIWHTFAARRANRPGSRTGLASPGWDHGQSGNFWVWVYYGLNGSNICSGCLIARWITCDPLALYSLCLLKIKLSNCVINMKMLYKALWKCKLLLLFPFWLFKTESPKGLPCFYLSPSYFLQTQCADSTRKTKRGKVESTQICL